MLLAIFYAVIFIGDAQIDVLSAYPDSIASMIADRIGSERVLDCGDLVEHGLMLEEVEYQRYGQIFPNSVPVPGNHDHYDGLNYWTWDTTVDLYVDGLHIVGFDSNEWADPTARTRLGRSLQDETFTILYLHHQIYSDNLRNGAIADLIRPALLPVIEAANVDLVISSHGHAYERHDDGKRTFLVIGGAGAPLDAVGSSPTQVVAVSAHHWLEVQPAGDGVTCLVHGLNGLLDSFTVEGPTVKSETRVWGSIKAMYR